MIKRRIRGYLNGHIVSRYCTRLHVHCQVRILRILQPLMQIFKNLSGNSKDKKIKIHFKKYTFILATHLIWILLAYNTAYTGGYDMKKKHSKASLSRKLPWRKHLALQSILSSITNYPEHASVCILDKSFTPCVNAKPLIKPKLFKPKTIKPKTIKPKSARDHTNSTQTYQILTQNTPILTLPTFSSKYSFNFFIFNMNPIVHTIFPTSPNLKLANELRIHVNARIKSHMRKFDMSCLEQITLTREFRQDGHPFTYEQNFLKYSLPLTITKQAFKHGIPIQGTFHHIMAPIPSPTTTYQELNTLVTITNQTMENIESHELIISLYDNLRRSKQTFNNLWIHTVEPQNKESPLPTFIITTTINITKTPISTYKSAIKLHVKESMITFLYKHTCESHHYTPFKFELQPPADNTLAKVTKIPYLKTVSPKLHAYTYPQLGDEPKHSNKDPLDNSTNPSINPQSSAPPIIETTSNKRTRENEPHTADAEDIMQGLENTTEGPPGLNLTQETIPGSQIS